jgi:2-methylene-furan-3-one reductase
MSLEMLVNCSLVGSNLRKNWHFSGECSKCVKVVKEGGAVIVLTGALEPPGVRFVVTSNGDNLAKLTPYLESGKVKPVIDSKGPFKFSDVVEAFEYLETGRATGKIVIGPIE